MSWPERYRALLEQVADTPLRLDDDDAGTVLQLAREVAHGTERRYAPLATFLAGQFVAARVEGGVSVSAALAEALSLARQVLPRADEE